MEGAIPKAVVRNRGTLKPLGRLTKVQKRVLELEAILMERGLGDLIPPPVEAGKNARSSNLDVEGVEEGGEDNGLVEGVGSLTIREDDGATRFLGLSAGSAYFGTADSESSNDEEITTNPPSLGPPVASIVTTYPFTGAGSSYPVSLGESKIKELEQIRNYLPSQEEGKRLSSNYWQFCSFMFEPVEESVFFEDYFPAAYAYSTDSSYNGTKLACVYIILALGSLFDPSAPSTFNATANQYFLLSQTALSASRFLSQNTLAGAQTIQLSGNFLFNTHKLQDGGETFFALLGLGLRMAVTMGLHRDGSKWGLAQPELDSRRLLFYELMALDRFQSYISGRPYMIHGSHFDTKVPSNVDDYQLIKWKLSIFVGKTIDEAFSVKVPTYATIQALDQELRDIFRASPPSLRSGVLPENAFLVRQPGVLPTPNPSSATLKARMRQYTLDMLFCQILLYLHKPSFAQALIHYPDEPLQAPWAASVAAVSLEAGVYVLAIAKHWILLDPILCPRWWHIFFHAFAATVAQSSLVIKSPGSMLAQHAWLQLNEAVQIFEDASVNGAPVKMFLPRVKLLRDNAYIIMNSAVTVPKNVGDNLTASPESFGGGDDDSIAGLGASTRLSRKPKRLSRQHSNDSTTPSQPSPTQYPVSIPAGIDYNPFDISQYGLAPPAKPIPAPGFDMEFRNYPGFSAAASTSSLPSLSPHIQLQHHQALQRPQPSSMDTRRTSTSSEQAEMQERMALQQRQDTEMRQHEFEQQELLNSLRRQEPSMDHLLNRREPSSSSMSSNSIHLNSLSPQLQTSTSRMPYTVNNLSSQPLQQATSTSHLHYPSYYSQTPAPLTSTSGQQWDVSGFPTYNAQLQGSSAWSGNVGIGSGRMGSGTGSGNRSPSGLGMPSGALGDEDWRLWSDLVGLP